MWASWKTSKTYAVWTEFTIVVALCRACSWEISVCRIDLLPQNWALAGLPVRAVSDSAQGPGTWRIPAGRWSTPPSSGPLYLFICSTHLEQKVCISWAVCYANSFWKPLPWRVLECCKSLFALQNRLAYREELGETQIVGPCTSHSLIQAPAPTRRGTVIN